MSSSMAITSMLPQRVIFRVRSIQCQPLQHVAGNRSFVIKADHATHRVVSQSEQTQDQLRAACNEETAFKKNSYWMETAFFMRRRGQLEKKMEVGMLGMEKG